MATHETIRQVVQLLFAAPLANKPDERSIGATTKVFIATLSDIPDDLLKAAVTQHIATSKWFPAVADLRETAVSLVHLADDVPDAYTAWQQVKRVFRGGPEPHPLATKTINALGGLAEFGKSDISDEPSWRARFVAAYESYQRREAESTMMLPAVAGYIEARRELNGQSIGGMIAALTGQLKS